MIQTEAVYYQEPYRKELDAKVLAIDGNIVILDRTICYPEGGGQPGDRGMIGSSRLLDTQKTEEHEIHHIVDKPTFSVGDEVHISLDWPHRYFYMQEHAAQHTISGTLFTRFSIGTVAVHEGEEILTVETDQNEIPLETCYALEDAINQVIREGHAIHYGEMSHEDAEKLGMRRSIKVSGPVRIVVIDGVDMIACGGLHVANTREIGLVQYVGQEMIRSHVRLVFRVAENALREIRHNRNLVEKLCALHSATPIDLLEVEQRQLDAYHTLKAEDAHLKLDICRSHLSTLHGVATWDITSEVFDLKDLAQCLDPQTDLALCAVRQEGEKLYWLMAFCGSYRGFAFNAHRTDLLGPIHGKGGGRDPLYQGMGEGAPEALFQAFSRVLE
jgi:alanyl-tRNA synthetase